MNDPRASPAAYEAKVRQNTEIGNMKMGQTLSEPNILQAGTIRMMLEELSQHIEQCQKGACVLGERIYPVLEPEMAMEISAEFVGNHGVQGSDVLETVRNLIKRVVEVEYRLQSLCDRVQL